MLIFCLDGFTNQTFGNGYESITTDSKLKDRKALLQTGSFQDLAMPTFSQVVWIHLPRSPAATGLNYIRSAWWQLDWWHAQSTDVINGIY